MTTNPSATYPLQPHSKVRIPCPELVSAQETIAAEGPTNLQIFTDRSTLIGTENGGTGVVVFRGNTLIQSWHAPTGTFRNSFQAEKTALIAAMSWLEQNDDWFSASLITDCKSLLQALSYPNITDLFLLSLNTSIAVFYPTKNIRLIWVLGHCNFPDNDLADEQAKLDFAFPQTTAPLDSQTRLAIIRRSCKPPPPTHPRRISLTVSRPNPEKESQLSMKDLSISSDSGLVTIPHSENGNL